MRNVLTAALGIGALAVLVAMPAATGVFSSDSVIELTIEAPFSDLFARAESQDDYAVTGRIVVGDGGILNVRTWNPVRHPSASQ